MELSLDSFDDSIITTCNKGLLKLPLRSTFKVRFSGIYNGVAFFKIATKSYDLVYFYQFCNGSMVRL